MADNYYRDLNKMGQEFSSKAASYMLYEIKNNTLVILMGNSDYIAVSAKSSDKTNGGRKLCTLRILSPSMECVWDNVPQGFSKVTQGFKNIMTSMGQTADLSDEFRRRNAIWQLRSDLSKDGHTPADVVFDETDRCWHYRSGDRDIRFYVDIPESERRRPLASRRVFFPVGKDGKTRPPMTLSGLASIIYGSDAEADEQAEQKKKAHETAQQQTAVQNNTVDAFADADRTVKAITDYAAAKGGKIQNLPASDWKGNRRVAAMAEFGSGLNVKITAVPGHLGIEIFDYRKQGTPIAKKMLTSFDEAYKAVDMAATGTR